MGNGVSLSTARPHLAWRPIKLQHARHIIEPWPARRRFKLRPAWRDGEYRHPRDCLAMDPAPLPRLPQNLSCAMPNLRRRRDCAARTSTFDAHRVAGFLRGRIRRIGDLMEKGGLATAPLGLHLEGGPCASSAHGWDNRHTGKWSLAGHAASTLIESHSQSAAWLEALERNA
jgi:hypothetical protein